MRPMENEGLGQPRVGKEGLLLQLLCLSYAIVFTCPTKVGTVITPKFLPSCSEKEMIEETTNQLWRLGPSLPNLREGSLFFI